MIKFLIGLLSRFYILFFNLTKIFIKLATDTHKHIEYIDLWSHKI